MKSTLSSAQLQALLEVSALLNSTLDLEGVLTRILEASGDLMSAEASNVMLLNSSRSELIYEVALGTAGSKIKQECRLKIGVGIAGWVAEHETPLLIEDAYSDPRFFSDFDKKTGFKTRSVVCIPLHAQGKLIGVAQIINKKETQVFRDEDLALFLKFGAIASVAIDNALMHRRILDQDRVTRDLLLAQEIQNASLPMQTPSMRGLRAQYRAMACRQVGGDVIEILELPDQRLAVLIADVSGKGVPAALFGAKLATEFAYELKVDTSPESLLERLNNAVCKRSTRGMFVTAIYAIIDSLKGEVEFVNAGHLEPVIVGPLPGQSQKIKSGGYPPLGVVADQKYKVSRYTLVPGMHWVMMTDGVTEAKAASGARWGDRPVALSLSQNPSNAIAHLMHALVGFTQGESLADDITLVGIWYGDHRSLTLKSDPAELPKVRQLVSQVAGSLGFSTKMIGRIELAVSEAMTNIIRHTYKMNINQKIEIGIGSTSTDLEIFLRDWGPKQDSTKFKSRDLSEVRPGGLGVHYMKQTMDVVEYDHSHGVGNEVFMSIRCPESERGRQ